MHNSNKTHLRVLACLSTFAFGGGQAMMIALYPALAWALNLDLSTLIYCFSVGSFLFLVGSPFWSNTSDFLGRHQVLTIGTAALLLSFALIVYLVWSPITNTIFVVSILLASQIIYGLVASATVPAAQALHVDLADKSSSVRAILVHSMSLSFGRVVGYALIVFFHEQFKSELFVYVIFLTFVFLILFFYSSKVPKYLKPASEPSSWRFEALNIKWIVTIAFLYACFLETVLFSLAGIIQTQFKFDSLSSSGLGANILLVMSFGIFLVEGSSRTFLKESWKLGLFIGVISLFIGSLFLVKAHSLAELWISMGFCVVGIGILPSFYLSFLRQVGSQASYGKRAGIIAAAHTLGYSSGGAIAAFAFKNGNNQVGFILAIIAIGLGFVCLKQSKIMDRIYAREAL